MSTKYNAIFLLLLVPSTVNADGGWLSLAYLSILIPISFLPFIFGLIRIRYDEKNLKKKIKGSIFIYTAISLMTCSMAIIFFSKVGIVHYFVLTTIGPLSGYLIFKLRSSEQFNKENIRTTHQDD